MSYTIRIQVSPVPQSLTCFFHLDEAKAECDHLNGLNVGDFDVTDDTGVPAGTGPAVYPTTPAIKSTKRTLQSVSVEEMVVGDKMYRLLTYREPEANNAPMYELYEACSEYEESGDCETGPQMTSCLGDFHQVSGGMGHVTLEEILELQEITS